MTLISHTKSIIKSSLFRDLLAGSSAAFLFKVGGSAATFIFTLLMARAFQAKDAGIYFLVLAISEILTMVARVGLPQSIVAFVGRNTALKNHSAVKGALQTSMQYIAASSILIGIALFIAAPLLNPLFKTNEDLTPYFYIIPMAILPFALFHLVGNALRGLGHIRQSQFIISFCPQMLQLFGLLIIMQRQSIAHVIWMYAAAGWITSALSYIMWYRHTRHMRKAKAEFSTRVLFATAIPLYITNLLMIVNARAGTFALGVLADPADVLVYNVALRISLLSGFALFAVNAYCGPKFAALHGTGDYKQLGQVTRQATMLAICAALPLMLIIFIIPEMVLSIFGPALDGSRSILITLVIGQCVSIATGPVGMLLAMTGHEKKLRNIYLATTLLNVVLQLILIPAFKANGAAWATTASIVTVNLSALYLVRHQLGISLFPRFIIRMIGQ